MKRHSGSGSNSISASLLALVLLLSNSGIYPVYALGEDTSGAKSREAAPESTAKKSESTESPESDTSSKEKLRKARVLFKEAVDLYLENEIPGSVVCLSKIYVLLGKKLGSRIETKLKEISKNLNLLTICPQQAELLGEHAAFLYDVEYSPEFVGQLESGLAGKLFDLWQKDKQKKPDSKLILAIKSLCDASLENFKKTGDKKLIATAYCRVGDVATNQGRYADSERCFTKALELGMPENHVPDAFALLIDSLIIQDKIDQYKSVIDKFREKYGDKYPDFCKSQLAYYYFRVGKLDQAEKILKSTESKDGIYSSNVETNLAKVCIEQGKFEEAKEHLINSEKVLAKKKSLSNKLNASFLRQMERKLIEHRRKYSGTAILGLKTKRLTEENRKSLGYDETDFGVIVQDIAPASKAEKAGLMLGDLIQCVNKNVISTPSVLRSYLDSINEKTNLEFAVKREGKFKKLKLSFDPKYKARNKSKPTAEKNFPEAKEAIITRYKEYLKACAEGDAKVLDNLVYASYFAGDPDSTKYSDIRQSVALKRKYPHQKLKTVIVDIKGKGDEAVIRSIDLYNARENLRLDGTEKKTVLEAYLLADNYLKNIDGEWKIVAIKNIDSLSTIKYGEVYGASLDLEVSPGIIKSGKNYIADLNLIDSAPEKVSKKIAFFRKDSSPLKSSNNYEFQELSPNSIEQSFTAGNTNNTESVLATVKYFNAKKNSPIGFIQIAKIIPTSKREDTFARKAHFTFTSKEVLSSISKAKVKKKKRSGKNNAAAAPAETPLVITNLNAMAQKNNTNSQVALGNYYSRRSQYKKAYLLFRKAAEKGSIEAQRNIYILSLKSGDISKEDGKKWLKKAIAQNDPESMVLLAREFSYSKKRAELLDRASKLGSEKAKAELGYMYINGIGVEKDLKKGLSYLKSAVENNYAPAEYQLGVYHLRNAIDWLYRASTHGNVQADDYLTKMKKSGMVR